MGIISSTIDIIIILLGFGMLIFVHEMGHFLAAKWAGIRTEAFAIGMGPVVASWRKGVGIALGSTDRKVVAAAGRHAHELSDAELARHGIGETEYSLRWVPIGGFVKMLGQEDANPTAVSSDPRSYTQRPIGKRMIVVSAGVVMNLLLAAVLFVFAFLVGVPLLAPVVGDVRAAMPAASAVAHNADAMGVTEPGVRPGDRILSIDGKATRTFADIQIASAMSKPGEPLDLTVERAGVPEPLSFTILPEKDRLTQLLSIGVAPAASTTLMGDDNAPAVKQILELVGLGGTGVEPGMRVTAIDGVAIETFEAVREAARRSGGTPVAAVWTTLDDDGAPTGSPIRAAVPVVPEYQVMYYAGDASQRALGYEEGLLGLTPLVRIDEVLEGSPNAGVLEPGDVVLAVGGVPGPRRSDLREAVAAAEHGSLTMRVLRDGVERDVTLAVRKGMIRVSLDYAWDIPVIAAPMDVILPSGAKAARPTPFADLDLPPRSRIVAVGGTPIDGWPALRETLRAQTREAFAAGDDAEVTLDVAWPTPGAAAEPIAVRLAAADVATLHALAWETRLPGTIFEPIQTIRSAGGNPLTALIMGVEETHKHVLLTYITIDRLFRRSVGVEQIRGPLGIVHMGSTLLDRGFIYLVFLLAMISVNLAVINFLPIPIVDGGLFLFLVYEKIKGRPPSLAFQNAATIVGLFLIGTVFLVVTWNDVVRLIG